MIVEPTLRGSYAAGDVTMLLTEVSDPSLELATERRAELLRHGGHYSETLPVEYQPTTAYEALFHRLLASSADRIGLLTRVLARRIVAEHHAQPVLVSLARAGTPVGVLLRRALSLDGIAAPHFTISIVRGRGLDARALDYLLSHFDSDRLVFVDGWTGKGAIQAELKAALEQYRSGAATPISPTLAVLADPAHVAALCASRGDELIPSACLNSTVSGLISRTVIRPDLTGPDAFHGVRIYREFAERDFSRHYVDRIASSFSRVDDQLDDALRDVSALAPADGRGMTEVAEIQREWSIDDIHRVKPGVGETTRVLLRRLPRAVLLDPRRRAALEHIIMLARDRGVEIVERPTNVYSCFGLIEE